MPTTLTDLETTSRRITGTPARSEKTAILAELLRRLGPDEIEIAVAFLSGDLRQGRIGLGPAAIHEAARGSSSSAAQLTLAEVDQAFARIAALSGPGSVGERTRHYAALLGRATEAEKSFLIRLASGELRQGALEGVMEDAVARAAAIPLGEIRAAAMRAGDLRAVAQAALTEGRAGLARFQVQMFRPLQPMLAQPTDGLDEAMTRLGTAVLEYKLDGARVQVHRSGDQVRVYSRGLKDVTHAVPELVDVVLALPEPQLILDGEVLAMRPDGGPHTFQTTMRRFGRKLEVARVREELPLTPFFFDALRVGAQDLIGAPARERFAALAEVAGDRMVTRLLTADRDAAEAFLDQALSRGHEGIMAKAPDAPYEAGGRGAAWLKVKPAHTLDLVVLAAEWGHGRRHGWLSNIHLGARDPATGGFAMLGKTFKGMTDEMLAWQTARFQEIAVTSEGHVVHLRPELVVEVAFNDVQRSPQYESGMALRFARVKRYRSDKSLLEADTIDQVRAILENDERGGRRGG